MIQMSEIKSTESDGTSAPSLRTTVREQSYSDVFYLELKAEKDVTKVELAELVYKIFEPDFKGISFVEIEKLEIVYTAKEVGRECVGGLSSSEETITWREAGSRPTGFLSYSNANTAGMQQIKTIIIPSELTTQLLPANTAVALQPRLYLRFDADVLVALNLYARVKGVRRHSRVLKC